MSGAVSQLPNNILLVEDDPSLSSSLVDCLEAEGYQVRIAGTGKEALRLYSEHAPDLVLLDIMLPDISGFEVCRSIRASAKHAQPAIVILTARTQEIDRVAGFEVGADDFVAKPFSLRELMLRLQARLQLRSTTQAVSAAVPEQQDKTHSRVALGALEIDRASHRVFLSAREIHLSVQEMRLLDYLASEPGKLRTRQDLLSTVWGYHPEATSRTLDTHIKRLRDKFGPLAAMIQTVHGVGYRLTAAVSQCPGPIPRGDVRRRR